MRGLLRAELFRRFLANIYLDRLDRRWVELGMDRRCGENAQMVRYADDIVILTDN